MSTQLCHPAHGVVEFKEAERTELCLGCCMYNPDGPEGCEAIGLVEFDCFPSGVFVKVQLHVGDTFSAVCLSGRVITLGKVLKIEEGATWPYNVRWYDEQGKHYEWFNLREFKEFSLVHTGVEDVQEGVL